MDETRITVKDVIRMCVNELMEIKIPAKEFDITMSVRKVAHDLGEVLKAMEMATQTQPGPEQGEEEPKAEGAEG